MGNSKSSENAEKIFAPLLIDAKAVEWIQDENGEQTPGTVIASGSQGTVYKTKYAGQTVALKVFHSAIFSNLSFSYMMDEFKTSTESKQPRRRRSIFGRKETLSEPEFNIPEESLQEFYTEVRTLRFLHHPGCLALYSICLRPFTFMCMEYCPVPLNTLLFSDLEISQYTILRWMRQIAYGLIYLHGKGVAHRDLKPENILLTDFDPEIADTKLCDFGIAQLDRFRPMRGIGSPMYTAPEVVEQTKGALCDFRAIDWRRADIYSFTVVMWVMMARQLPIPRADERHSLDFTKMLSTLRDLGTWPLLTEMLAQSWKNLNTRLPLDTMLTQIINPEFSKFASARRREN